MVRNAWTLSVKLGEEDPQPPLLQVHHRRVQVLQDHLGRTRARRRRELQRARCWVGPNDASWPVHSSGNTADAAIEG